MQNEGKRKMTISRKEGGYEGRLSEKKEAKGRQRKGKEKKDGRKERKSRKKSKRGIKK